MSSPCVHNPGGPLLSRLWEGVAGEQAWVAFDPYCCSLDPGEEWLVRSVGAYLPAVFEEVLDLVDAVILTEKVCALVAVDQGTLG